MHSGSEYSVSPSDWFGKVILNEDPDADEDYSPDFRSPRESDIELRHFAIDQGADAVICHHPHIIHGFEVYNGKLIAHSLGNFVFDLNYPETFPTVILNSKIDETGFYEYNITPVYIDDYIPVQARGELGLYLLDDLAKRSKDLNTYLKIDRENITAEIVLDTTTLIPYQFSSTAELILEEENGVWISEPVLLEREGSISSIDDISPAGNWQYRLGRELIWFGNFEDEGCTLWEINHPDEFYDTTESFTGKRSLCQERPSGLLPLNTNLEKRIKLYSNTADYTLHAYIKTENSVDAGALLQFFETRYQYDPIGTENLDTEISGTTGWTFYNNEFSLPNGTEFINLRLRSESPQSGEAHSWFDNVGLIEWSDWKDYNSISNVSYPNDYYWVQFKTSESILNANVNYTETNFSNIINPTNITVQSPNGGEVWIVNETEDITWTSQNVNDVMIELSTDNGATWTTIESSVPNTGTYTWTVAALDSSDECLIRIRDVVNTSIKDVSDGVFTIDIITVTSFQFTVSILDGWNMVSVPGLHPVDQNVTTWWSGKDPAAGVFKYNGGYTEITTATPTEGYWMKNVGAQIYSYPAIQIVPHDPINCAGGWNLIGIYEIPVDTADLIGIIPPVYGYFGGYQTVDSLFPGYGYFCKM